MDTEPEFAALREAYADLTTVTGALTQDQAWLPTGSLGWGIQDLIFHCLSDANRALRALGSPPPDDTAPDRDAVTYWQDWQPGYDAAGVGLRSVRVGASAYGTLAVLAEMYAESTAAVVTLSRRAEADDLATTQGHVLRVADLVSTLAVEAAIHHLDLLVSIDRPGPGPLALAEVRRVLDGLLGQPEPVGWDDRTYALAGTGRRELTQADRERLGALAGRFPLFS